MRNCLVPGCDEAAVRGDEWSEDDALEPLLAYQSGIELRLRVVDIAVRLSLCQRHANEVTESAWQSVEARLRGWGWQPLGGATG
ncbi:MAG TPA: hypothetical protein VIJ11_10175 [Galbitalea sp.]